MRCPFLLILLSFSLWAGCGRSDLVPAGGVVTFNGAAEPKANVTFIRIEGQGPAAAAVTDTEGRFDLTTNGQPGALPGKYKVLVQKDTSADLDVPAHQSAGEYMLERGMLPRPVLPLIYTDLERTPLRAEVDVDAAPNEFAIELEGDRPKAVQHAPRKREL